MRARVVAALRAKRLPKSAHYRRFRWRANGHEGQRQLGELISAGQDAAHAVSALAGDSPSIERPEVLQGSACEHQGLPATGVALRYPATEVILEPVRLSF